MSSEFLEKEQKEKIQDRGNKLLKVQRVLFAFLIIVAVLVAILHLQSKLGLKI